MAGSLGPEFAVIALPIADSIGRVYSSRPQHSGETMPWDNSRTPPKKSGVRFRRPAATKLTPAQDEVRRAIRIQSHDLKIIYDGCTDWVDVRSPDISTTGAFINTPHAFPKGTKLKLRFELPGTGTRIQAVGEVRYCLPGVGAGVEFVDLHALARTAIQKYIDAMAQE